MMLNCPRPPSQASVVMVPGSIRPVDCRPLPPLEATAPPAMLDFAHFASPTAQYTAPGTLRAAGSEFVSVEFRTAAYGPDESSCPPLSLTTCTPVPRKRVVSDSTT